MMYRMCQEFHCLPGPGGLFEQDSYVVYGLQAISLAIAARDEKEQQLASQRGQTKLTSGPSIRRR